MQYMGLRFSSLAISLGVYAVDTDELICLV